MQNPCQHHDTEIHICEVCNFNTEVKQLETKCNTALYLPQLPDISRGKTKTKKSTFLGLHYEV